MKLLVDVDAVAKLANWQVLLESPSVLGCSVSDCATVTSLRFRAMSSTKKADGKLFQNTEAATLALQAIEKMGALAEIDDSALVEFENINGIDPGEALLFSEVISHPHVYVLTGDKRALRSLSALPESTRVQLAGRVILIEQVLLRLLDVHGLAWLRERVCPAKQLDKAVNAIMGSRCDAGEQSVRDGMASYIREIAVLYDPSLLAQFSSS